MSNWNEQIIEEFRAGGGTVATNGFGRGLVLVHHRGARSGAERISPLAGIPVRDGVWLIAASFGGSDRNPAWLHNLVAHPDVRIEVPDADGGIDTVDVRARVLTGDERDAEWRRFTARSAGFAAYERKTSRVIPVVELTRR